MKWNMGWMHDILTYFSKDPVYRRYNHDQLTFGLMYAFTEKGEKYELNVTGGMSWGDSPTEAYDAFNRAAFFDEIYNLAIDFSVGYCKMYA